MMRNLFVVMILLLCAQCVVASQLTGQERIIQYDIVAHMKEDASMVVTETIIVESNNKHIKRGIYRDFETTFKDKYGNKKSVKFNLLSVKRDGNDEPYFTEHIGHEYRLYIGDKHTVLPPGIYAYEITYDIDNGVSYFEEYDELYWDMVGHHWLFPVEHASVKVLLPQDTDILQFSAYTGRLGSKQGDYTTKKLSNGMIFELTEPLNAHEGFTVALAWSKGIVQEPTEEEKLKRWQEENVVAIYSVIFFSLILLFYLISWYLIGRDPKRGTIIPLYEPPKGFSPAMLHYISHMGFNDQKKAFAAALINLAVKGYVKVSEISDDYHVTRIKKDPGEELGIGEKTILAQLFVKNDNIALTRSNSTTIQNALSEFKRSIKSELRNYYFVTNKVCFMLAVFITFIYFIGVIVLADDSFETLFMIAWLTGWTIALVTIGMEVIKHYANMLKKRKNSFWKLIISILFAAPFLVGEFFGTFILATQTTFLGAIILIIIIICHSLFYHWLKKPTLTGRQVMDKIDGFKMYLTTAERDEIRTAQAPTMSTSLFESYLPFALALGLEYEWAEHFEKEMSQSLADSTIGVANTYRPTWYSGSSSSMGSMAGGLSGAAIASSIGTAVASGISSSVSSSSGSSGGGFSGGGGGGGGGGGW